MRWPSEVLDNVNSAGWLLAAEDRAELDRTFTEEGVPTYVNEEVAVQAGAEFPIGTRSDGLESLQRRSARKE